MVAVLGDLMSVKTKIIISFPLSCSLCDSPSSASDAERMGVIGGWSPASLPFLGRFMPAERRAFTWWKEFFKLGINHLNNKIDILIALYKYNTMHLILFVLILEYMRLTNPVFSAHIWSYLFCPDRVVDLLLQGSLQVKVLRIVSGLSTWVADVALRI